MVHLNFAEHGCRHAFLNGDLILAESLMSRHASVQTEASTSTTDHGGWLPAGRSNAPKSLWSMYLKITLIGGGAMANT